MPQTHPPRVSVVTPVYNGEAYLAECVRSVLAQTFRNFEYVIVNNCSTDRTLEIARTFAAADPRIRICCNERFLSALQNFNQAMRQMDPGSRYCKVVHADDWLYPECLEKMVALAEAHPAVGIVGSYRLVGTRLEADGLPYQRRVFPGREVARMNLLDGPYTFGTPSALLLRADLVRAREQFYNEAHSGADTEACLELLRECDFGFVHQVLSFCRQHPGAITGRQAALGTRFPNFLYVFKTHGPFFLSPVEYRMRLRRLHRGYYRFLGSRLWQAPPRGFWDFHRQGFRRLDENLSWSRVSLGAVRYAAEMLVASPRRVKALVAPAARS